jgi:S1-C subfamily serine protease
MHRSIAVRTWFLVLTCVLGPAGTLTRAQTSVVDVADAVTPSVVTITTFFAKVKTSRRASDAPGAVQVIRPGSGVIVDPKGLIVTNLHLVAELIGADGGQNPDYWALVTLPGGPLPGGRQYEAKIVATDVRADLALLEIATGAKGLPALPLGDATELAPGERVIAVSFPDTESAEIFAGVLLSPPNGTTKLREAELEPHETLLTDARFHRSLDGGPLVDMRGRVLGLHNSSHVTDRGEAFDEEDEEAKKKPNVDYAVIVSSAAIRAAFEKWLPADAAPLAPLARGEASEAVPAIAAIAPAVVSVWTGEGDHPAVPDVKDPHVQRPPAGLGSAVVLTPTGLVVTAADLFPGDTKRASVRTSDGKLFAAELVAISHEKRVALAQLALQDGVTLPVASLADSKSAIAGEFVAVVARPHVQTTLSAGVLSALERDGLVQVASWVHRGHLGGAIADRQGRLLAIAVEQPTPAMGRAIKSSSFLGFATPLAAVFEAFASELAERGVAAPAADEAGALEARRTAPSWVVDLTRSSLVNVIVSKALPAEATGFNPFDEPEAKFALLGQGSGVIIDPSGLALTNWHVVSAALDGLVPRADHRVEVTLPTGDRYDADVLSTSRDDDLALIMLKLKPGQELVPVELGDSSALRAGQPVIAIGNPLGLANSVTRGIVSRKSIDARISGRLHEYKGMVMVDAAINPGNSGGALLDEAGRLIGINSAGRVGAGMAIPVDKAREVFAGKLLAAESLRSSFLGFQVKEAAGGLVVSAVDELGPAESVGLVAGDELLAIDGREGLSRITLAQTLLGSEPGVPLVLRIGRGGEVLEKTVVPMAFAAWNAFRQSGILVQPVDYAAESELVFAASVAMHRVYTGDAQGRPARLASGALRVIGVRSLDASASDPGSDHPVRAGDLLLGITVVTPGEVNDVHELRKLETLAALAVAFEERATKEGELCELWVYRDGAVQTVKVWIRRVPRGA